MGPACQVVRGSFSADGGHDAESLTLVAIPLRPRPAIGTDIAGMLKNKGYDGP